MGDLTFWHTDPFGASAFIRDILGTGDVLYLRFAGNSGVSRFPEAQSRDIDLVRYVGMSARTGNHLFDMRSDNGTVSVPDCSMPDGLQRITLAGCDEFAPGDYRRVLSARTRCIWDPRSRYWNCTDASLSTCATPDLRRP